MLELRLSVHEIAAHLDVSSDTIYKWIIRKKMPQGGADLEVQGPEVDAWVVAGKAGEPHHNAGLRA